MCWFLNTHCILIVLLTLFVHHFECCSSELVNGLFRLNPFRSPNPFFCFLIVHNEFGKEFWDLLQPHFIIFNIIIIKSINNFSPHFSSQINLGWYSSKLHIWGKDWHGVSFFRIGTVIGQLLSFLSSHWLKHRRLCYKVKNLGLSNVTIWVKEWKFVHCSLF